MNVAVTEQRRRGAGGVVNLGLAHLPGSAHSGEKALRRTSRGVEALARTLAAQLRAWLERAVRRELTTAKRDPRRYIRGKKRESEAPPPPEDELRRLLVRFGSRRIADVAEKEGAVIPGTLVRDAIAGKPVRIKVFQEWLRGVGDKAASLASDVRERVRESVRTVLADADQEEVSPTIGELTRRIATTIHAVEPKGGGDTDRVYVFSWQRAETIARTEMVQVENTGKMVGFEETGVEAMEWLAYSDGLSGERHHERMDGVVVRLGDSFKTPLGNRLRYPGDPMAPIEDTANCRCTMRPARERR